MIFAVIVYCQSHCECKYKFKNGMRHHFVISIFQAWIILGKGIHPLHANQAKKAILLLRPVIRKHTVTHSMCRDRHNDKKPLRITVRFHFLCEQTFIIMLCQH